MIAFDEEVMKEIEKNRIEEVKKVTQDAKKPQKKNTTSPLKVGMKGLSMTHGTVAKKKSSTIIKPINKISK